MQYMMGSGAYGGVITNGDRKGNDRDRLTFGRVAYCSYRNRELENLRGGGKHSYEQSHHHMCTQTCMFPRYIVRRTLHPMQLCL